MNNNISSVSDQINQVQSALDTLVAELETLSIRQSALEEEKQSLEALVNQCNVMLDDSKLNQTVYIAKYKSFNRELHETQSRKRDLINERIARVTGYRPPLDLDESRLDISVSESESSAASGATACETSVESTFSTSTPAATPRFPRPQQHVSDLLDAAVAKINDLSVVNSSSSSDRASSACNICGNYNHSTSRCNLQRKCHKCDRVGHIAKKCPVPVDQLSEDQRRRNNQFLEKTRGIACGCGGACSCRQAAPSSLGSRSKPAWFARVEIVGSYIDWSDDHLEFKSRDQEPWAVQRKFLAETEQQRFRSEVTLTERNRNYELIVTGYDFKKYFSDVIRAIFKYLCTYRNSEPTVRVNLRRNEVYLQYGPYNLDLEAVIKWAISQIKNLRLSQDQANPLSVKFTFKNANDD